MSDSRQYVHELIDQLDAGQLAAVGRLLEVMIHDDDEELTEEDRAAIQAGLASLDKNGGIPMEDILADFGMTMLLERFDMTVHHEKRNVQGYELIIAKNGPTLKVPEPPSAALSAFLAIGGRIMPMRKDKDGLPELEPGSNRWAIAGIPGGDPLHSPGAGI